MQLYREKLRIYFRPVIGTLPLAQLTTLMLQDILDGMQDRGLATSTVRNARSVVSNALRYAVKLIKENPAREVTTPKLKRCPKRAMSEAEAIAFVNKAREDEKNLKFIFWLYTDLRPVELIGLRWRYLELVREESVEYGLVKVRETVVRLMGGKWEFSTPKTDNGCIIVYDEKHVIFRGAQDSHLHRLMCVSMYCSP